MNDDTITDLKQFISATIAQQLAQQTNELRIELRQGLQETNQKIDDLSAYVAQALSDSNDAIAAQLQQHESRILKLEQRTV